MRYPGGLIRPDPLVPTIIRAPGLWTPNEYAQAKRQNIWPIGSMLHAFKNLDVASGLQLCLDVSSLDSYDGSSQTWADISGNGYDFYRGATSGSTTTDPTFNGSAGGLSSNEYWSFDGGDYFTPVAGGSGNTFINSIHKNNAAYTIAIWGRLGVHAPTNQYLFGNTQGAASTGFFLGFSTAAGLGNGRLRFAIYSGATPVLDVGGSAPFAIPTAGQWYLWAVSVDESTAAGMLYQNGTTHSFTSTYTSPSASDSANTLTLGAINTVLPLSNTSRMANLSVWNRALTQAELDAIFERTRGRFGV